MTIACINNDEAMRLIAEDVRLLSQALSQTMVPQNQRAPAGAAVDSLAPMYVSPRSYLSSSRQRGHPDERNKQFGRTRVSVRLDVQNSSFSNVRAGSVTCVFRRPAANDGAVLIEWRHGEELANTSVSVLSETASVGFLVRGLGQEVIDGAINGVFSVSLTLHICDLGRKPPPRPNSNHGAPLMLTPVLC